MILRKLIAFLKKHKGWCVAVAVVMLFVVAIPRPAEASWFSISDIAQAAVGKLVYALGYLFSLLAGLIVAIEAWFLNVIISISFGLVNSAPVKVGFPIMLSFANLFFVGGLIVIAIATILRQEQYGMKKVLWKLVVMAVAVNFGLVICGSLLSLSDSLTKFFIESISPGTSGPNGQSDFSGFASNITGAFNPQGSYLSAQDIIKNPSQSTQDLSAAAAVGDSIGEIVKPIISVLATLGALVIVIITLATLMLMLLYRYIKVGMMLITLPLAWAAWIFPAYQEHYKKWWTSFTKWVIFAPVVTFFLWLGLKVSEFMSKGAASGSEFEVLYKSNSTGMMKAISDFFGALFSPIISQTLKVFILFGIMMGGMVAAQELGIKFANAGYGAIEGAGKGAKSWAKRRVDRAAARPRAAIARSGAAVAGGVRRGAADTLRGLAPLARVRVPGMDRVVGGGKKWKLLDDRGRVRPHRVDAAPEETLAGKIEKKAGELDKVSDLEKRLNPGGEMRQKIGETFNEWQNRVGHMNKELKIKVDGGETEEQWKERVKRAWNHLVDDDPRLNRRNNESEMDWLKRVAATDPDLAYKEGTPESREEWERRVNQAVRVEQAKAAAVADKAAGEDKGILASVWGGATKGFKKGGHKDLSRKELDELLEKMGVHPPHDDSGGGHDGGHKKEGGDKGGGEGHH